MNLEAKETLWCAKTAQLSICPGYPQLSMWGPDRELPWKSLGELSRFRTYHARSHYLTNPHVLGDLFVLSLQEQV